MPDTPPTQDAPNNEIVTYMNDSNYHRMAEMFDLDYEDRRDDRTAEQLSFITDWAAEHTKSTDRLEHQMAIKNLIKSLGYSDTKQPLIRKLYRWARLDQRRRALEKEMETV